MRKNRSGRGKNKTYPQRRDCTHVQARAAVGDVEATVHVGEGRELARDTRLPTFSVANNSRTWRVYPSLDKSNMCVYLQPTCPSPTCGVRHSYSWPPRETHAHGCRHIARPYRGTLLSRTHAHKHASTVNARTNQSRLLSREQ